MYALFAILCLSCRCTRTKEKETWIFSGRYGDPRPKVNHPYAGPTIYGLLQSAIFKQELAAGKFEVETSPNSDRKASRAESRSTRRKRDRSSRYRQKRGTSPFSDLVNDLERMKTPQGDTGAASAGKVLPSEPARSKSSNVSHPILQKHSAPKRDRHRKPKPAAVLVAHVAGASPPEKPAPVSPSQKQPHRAESRSRKRKHVRPLQRRSHESKRGPSAVPARSASSSPREPPRHRPPTRHRHRTGRPTRKSAVPSGAHAAKASPHEKPAPVPPLDPGTVKAQKALREAAAALRSSLSPTHDDAPSCVPAPPTKPTAKRELCERGQIVVAPRPLAQKPTSFQYQKPSVASEAATRCRSSRQPRRKPEGVVISRSGGGPKAVHAPKPDSALHRLLSSNKYRGNWKSLEAKLDQLDARHSRRPRGPEDDIA